METVENKLAQNCPHLEVSKGIPAVGLWCPDCGSWLDMDDVSRWVREAERSRDEAYPMVEGDRFGEILREERQREVYRRRRVMYGLQSASVLVGRPEMVLVFYKERGMSYGCRIFYKEPRPVLGLESLEIEARPESILELGFHRDPVVRLVAEKVKEFHGERTKLSQSGEPAPLRRVFYAGEL